jgi:hypothetical protein
MKKDNKIGKIVLVNYSMQQITFTTKWLGKCTKIDEKYIYVERFAIWNEEEKLWESIKDKKKRESGGWYHHRCTFLTKKELKKCFYALLFI